MKKRLFSTFFLACSLSIFAQQQKDSTKVEQLKAVELTSTKFKLNQEQSGKIVTKITSAELRQYQGSSIVSLLNQLSGINIIGTNSTAGQNLSYQIRGGSNRQVLILIDGIAITNPSSIANDYDLRLLPLNQIESVEIIKGAASALYGSGAATAVINIKLKSAKKGTLLNFNTSVATNNSQDKKAINANNFTQAVTLSKVFNKSNLYFSFQDFNSSGMSAAKGSGFKDDPFNRQNILAKYQLKSIKNLKLTSLINYNRFTTNFDAGSFTDADNLSKSEEFRAGFQANYKYNKGDFTFKSAFNAIVNNNKKTSFPSVNKGNSLIFDAYNRYNFNKNIQVLVGLNTQKLTMNSFEIPFGLTALSKTINQADFNIVDPYVNVVLSTVNGFNLNVGVRLNYHSTYGSHGVYTINPSYNFKINKAKLKLMAAYSTAYITPTLFQLFSPNYGFNDLKPEENTSLESGFTYTAGSLYFDMVYFYRQEQNFIDFTLLDPATFAFGYRNTAQDFYAHGLETNFKIKVSNKIQFTGNYTFTKVAETKIRIPKNKFNAHLSWAAGQNTHFGLDFNFTDKRTDSFFDLSTFTSTKVVLKSYSLVSLQVNHFFLKKQFKLYGNLTNIFNVNYQELVGFTTRGRNFLIGIQYNIR